MSKQRNHRCRNMFDALDAGFSAENSSSLKYHFTISRSLALFLLHKSMQGNVCKEIRSLSIIENKPKVKHVLIVRNGFFVFFSLFFLPVI